MEQNSVHHLVRQARDGDRQAYAELVRIYWPRIHRWLIALTRNSHTAEEITQDVFLKAWVRIECFQGDRGFRAWVFRMARNAWIDRCRSHQSKSERGLPDSLGDREPGPVSTLLTQETQTKVQEAVDRLADSMRAPLLLRTQEDMPYKEIAQILSIEESIVRWRIFKARSLLLQQLKLHLDEKCDEL